MADAMLYRDAEYGALAVIREEGEGVRLITIDHAFAPQDYEAVLAALEQMSGGAVEETAGGTRWTFTDREEVVRANLDTALRLRGYVSDPLASRAILSVSEAVARNPDLPLEMLGYHVTEAVERAMRAQASAALGIFPPHVLAAPPAIRAFPRGAKDPYGEPLPFIRARALVRGEAAEADALCKRLREALGVFGTAVVRATVEPSAMGRLAVEFALAPTREAVAGLLEGDTPAFEASEIQGVRPVHITLVGLMDEAAATDLRERALAGGAAVAFERKNERTLIVRLLAGHEGPSLIDEAFQQRLVWLMRVLDRWVPTLESVGNTEPFEVAVGSLTAPTRGA
jgi:hypothetical protein